MFCPAGRVEKGRKKRNLFLLRVGGQCTVKRTSVPVGGWLPASSWWACQMYQHPCMGTGTGTPVQGWVQVSLQGDGYRHPCRGDCQTYQHPCTGTSTSIPRQIPANYTQDPVSLSQALQLFSPTTQKPSDQEEN